ncbi:DEAD/DEAH box helicase [Ligilactobacillus ruminis]|uniref:DEAD/DEAH box helicase n=1 Tax=Ligilactobacillus ruminis TaxID=1623 RepID=UPI0022DFF74E|nr:DEAD/DEAH box helicase [Ligilactobacillus ruminis]
MTEVISLRDAIAADLKRNEYLKKLHQQLLRSYALYLFEKQPDLSIKEIQDLLIFSDHMSKTTDISLEQLSLEIVITLNKMYPDSHSIKFYKNRIFEELGNFSRPSNEEFKLEKSVNSLAESVRKKDEQTSRKLPTGKGYFIGEQKGLYDSLSYKLNSFSAPTSMGKSFLMKMFIEEKVKSFARLNFVYLVPTKALISEVTYDLCSRLGNYLKEKNYRVVNHFDSIGAEDISTNFIYVMTPERFEYLLLNNFSRKIDYLFIDEAQNISKKDSRSTIYYRIFDLLKRQNIDPHVTFASPLIDNPQIYKRLVDPRNRDSLKANISPVSQIYFLLNSQGRFEVYDQLTSTFLRIDNLDILSSEVALYNLPGKTLVYRNSINNAVNGAKNWYRLTEEMTETNLDLSEYISKHVHPDYYLSNLVKKKIAYHFGKVPDEVRNKIEQAFREDDLDTIFCTSTLMEGVNLPADNIIIDSSGIGKRKMDEVQFKNLTGRVGRLSNSMLGNVFIVSKTDSAYERFKKLIESKNMAVKLSVESLIKPKIAKKVSNDLKSGDLSLSSVKEEVKSPQNFDSIRKFSLIYLNSLQTENENLVTEQFNKKISVEDRELIKNKFKEQYGDYKEDDVNFSVDQSVRLVDRVKDTDINYPQVLSDTGELNVEGTYLFLKELGEIFNWQKYESEIASSEEISTVLKDYAELLLHWMNSEPISELCSLVIKRRNNDYDFLDRDQKIRKRQGINSGTPIIGSMDESNLSIQVLMSALSDIKFKFSNYFLKFSQTILKERQLTELDNDWYKYLEYGSIDENIIWLEKLGYSRNSAITLVKSRGEAIITDEFGSKFLLKNVVESIDDTDIIQETEQIIKNYPALFLNGD